MAKFWLSFIGLLFPTSIIAAAVSSNTYDYIVVGSGPGGAPLAANLAKSGASVLLLEAGDDQGHNLNEEISAWFFLADNDPLMRWDFFVKYHSDETITSKYQHLTWKTTDGQFYVGTSPPAGAKQLGVYYPRSGTLGGCSTHNALCAVLPSDKDWQGIADLTGDKTWEPKNMRKYFIQLENDHAVPKGTPGHGFNGFLDISVNDDEWLQNQTQAREVLEATASIMGQDPTQIYDILQLDLNNASPDRDQQTGLFGFPTHRDLAGRRVSARNAISQVLNATNANGSKKYKFSLGLNSFVTKVLFKNTSSTDKTPRAIGVEYLLGQSMYSADPRYNASNPGKKMQAYARNEVILSGGSFNSPQMLKLSGIGPKAELKKFNIPVLVDSPGVGSNLQDNTEIGFIVQASKNFTNISPVCTYGAPGDPCLALWYQGKGPYAQGPLDALMVKTSAAALDERDLFMFALAGSFRGYWPSSTVNQVPSDPPNTFDFSIVKMHPTNNLGTVNLVSSNPRDMPDINFRFFEDAEAAKDLQAIKEGIQLGRKVFDSMGEPYTEVLPCEGNSDCNVEQVIIEQAWSHHASSTCAIGADKDPKAVLDSKFRVRGVNGLRVVDASSFPRTPGGFPVIPTFMISLKAADSILAAPCPAWA